MTSAAMKREPRKPTQKALKQMAAAMVYFLSIGWRKQDLDMLEELWWTVRDDNGAVHP